jgi:hypothetical protein
LLKNRAKTASLRCMTDTSVKELKTHTQSPFFVKILRLFFGRCLKDDYDILIFNTIFPNP